MVSLEEELELRHVTIRKSEKQIVPKVFFRERA
jgi:hypothetical protein